MLPPRGQNVGIEPSVTRLSLYMELFQNLTTDKSEVIRDIRSRPTKFKTIDVPSGSCRRVITNEK